MFNYFRGISMKIPYVKALFALFAFAFLSSSLAFSQDDPEWYKLTVYGDAYVAFDNDKAHGMESESYKHYRQLAVVNHKRNQMALNMLQFSASAERDIVRAKFTGQVGDIVNQGWTSAGVQFPFVQEAFVGFNLFEGFWLDAGYFLTHIGGESLTPIDNWLSSHSMVTYYEPFYHAGIRGIYEVTPTLTAELHILNGNAMYEDNNFNKSFGYKIAYANPNGKMDASYAAIIGNEVPNSPPNAKNHMLHNFCVGVQATDELEAKAQLDVGMLAEGKYNAENQEYEDATFIGASAQARYTFSEKVGATGRFSYFDNSDGAEAGEKISGIGVTLGCEYLPTSYSYIRFEGRFLSLDELDDKMGYIFYDGEEPVGTRLEAALNFGIMFDIY